MMHQNSPFWAKTSEKISAEGAQLPPQTPHPVGTQQWVTSLFDLIWAKPIRWAQVKCKSMV